MGSTRVLRRSLLLLLLTLAVAGAAGEKVALVTDLGGPVYVVGDLKGPVHLLQVLHDGDRLQLEEGGKVTLTSYADGRTDRAAGPCTLEVRAGKTVLQQGKADRLQSFVRGGSRALVPRTENLERLGGTTMSYVSRPTILAVKTGIFFSAQKQFLSPPRFHLECPSPGSVILRDKVGKELWRARAEATLQGPRLPPGDYVAESVSEDGFSNELGFQIIDPGPIEAARQEAERATQENPDDRSPGLLLLGVYLDHGLLGEAYDLIVEMRRQSPDDDDLAAIARKVTARLWPQ